MKNHKKDKRRAADSIFGPLKVIKIKHDPWGDLHRVGAALLLPSRADETLHQYALRLDTALSSRDPDEYIGGNKAKLHHWIVSLHYSRPTRDHEPSNGEMS